MKNFTYTHTKRNDQIWRLFQRPSKESYAFRIGFLGGQIDRFDEALLGKVLEQKSFNRHSQLLNSDLEGTADAKWLLSTPLTNVYASDRYRIVAASFSESDYWDSNWQVKQAVEWLRSKEVQLIFFQHRWMLTSVLQSVSNQFQKQCFSPVASV